MLEYCGMVKAVEVISIIEASGILITDSFTHDNIITDRKF